MPVLTAFSKVAKSSLSDSASGFPVPELDKPTKRKDSEPEAFVWPRCFAVSSISSACIRTQQQTQKPQTGPTMPCVHAALSVLCEVLGLMR